jgi:hypothetical protein
MRTYVEVDGNTHEAVMLEDGRHIRDIERGHQHF